MQQSAKKINCPSIKDYEVIGKIGEGGLAEIFKARQISLNRPVAIKVLFPQYSNDPDIVMRFDRESVTVARLNHPNIVHIIDKGQSDKRYYFIMEYVDGTSFKELIHSPKIALRKKLNIIVMMLKGLDYAHKNGVIHRDIKPANILVDRQGNAMVADFGIAHIATKNPDAEMTGSDVIMGTMAYMSPEQKISSANVDSTTDIYAVGVMIYEILTGRRPSGRFKLPTELNPQLPKQFDTIIKNCLAQDPSDRYQTAIDLKDALLNAMAGDKNNEPVSKSNDARVNSFIGNCQFLDTLKDTRYSNTMLVENTSNNELYVIKKNNRSTDGLKEARILTNLKHENIINIYGAGSDEKRLVVVMEYAAGGSLDERLIKTFPFDEAIKIAVDIANALSFAVQNWIVHGNLRPSNILFTNDGQIKISDFGLPPHYNLMEKNWYAAPEKRVSSQADVYGLGVIIYKLLFDKNPAYDRASNLVVDKSVSGLPMGFEKILQKMLSIRVAQRYRTVDEFLHDWDAIESAMADCKPKKKPVQIVPKKKNMKPLFIIGSILIVITLTMIILYNSGAFK